MIYKISAADNYDKKSHCFKDASRVVKFYREYGAPGYDGNLIPSLNRLNEINAVVWENDKAFFVVVDEVHDEAFGLAIDAVFVGDRLVDIENGVFTRL